MAIMFDYYYVLVKINKINVMKFVIKLRANCIDDIG